LEVIIFFASFYFVRNQKNKLIQKGFGGAVYIGWSSLLVRFDVDDPLEASSVHLGAGLHFIL